MAATTCFPDMSHQYSWGLFFPHPVVRDEAITQRARNTSNPTSKAKSECGGWMWWKSSVNTASDPQTWACLLSYTTTGSRLFYFHMVSSTKQRWRRVSDVPAEVGVPVSDPAALRTFCFLSSADKWPHFWRHRSSAGSCLQWEVHLNHIPDKNSYEWSLNCDILILLVKGHDCSLYVATVTVSSRAFYMNAGRFIFWFFSFDFP